MPRRKKMKMNIEELIEYLNEWPLGEYASIMEGPDWTVWIDELRGGFRLHRHRRPERINPEDVVEYIEMVDDDGDYLDPVSIVEEIERWRKERTTTVMVFEVPKGQEGEVEAAMARLGAEVRK